MKGTADAFRSRIAQEDRLLNDRTHLFLVGCSILIIAAAVPKDLTLSLVASITGLLVTICWFFCSWQSRKVIAGLTRNYLTQYPNSEIEAVVQSALPRPGRWLRPTSLIGIALPSVFLIVWIALICVFSCRLIHPADPADPQNEVSGPPAPIVSLHVPP
jgi:hypothetical protein